MPEQRIPTKAEVESYLRDRRNWGRWGTDDQVGAMNLITPQKRVSAASLVRTGRAVSLSREFPKTPAPNNPTPAQHFMRLLDRGSGGAASHYYGVSHHRQGRNPLDSLWPGWDSNGQRQGRRPRGEVGFGGAGCRAITN